MISERIWISEEDWNSIKLNASEHYPNETGGILVGYVIGDDIVVCGIVGPGPRAKHRRKNFTPDASYQFKKLDSIYRETNGSHVYLGDWHTHPNGSNKMSYLDRKTLMRIAKKTKNLNNQPIMAIVSGYPDFWKLCARQYVSKTDSTCSTAIVRKLSLINYSME